MSESGRNAHLGRCPPPPAAPPSAVSDDISLPPQVRKAAPLGDIRNRLTRRRAGPTAAPAERACLRTPLAQVAPIVKATQSGSQPLYQQLRCTRAVAPRMHVKGYCRFAGLWTRAPRRQAPPELCSRAPGFVSESLRDKPRCTGTYLRLADRRDVLQLRGLRLWNVASCAPVRRTRS